MRYEKRVTHPKAKLRRVRLSAEAWKEHALVLHHLRFSNGALTLAEGTSPKWNVSTYVDNIVASGSEIFGSCSNMSTVYELTLNRSWPLRAVFEVCDYVQENGVRLNYMLAPDLLYFDEGSTLYNYGKKPSGRSIAVHKDRLFYAASDEKVYWTYLFPLKGFKTTGTQESGSFDVVDNDLGKVMRLISFREKLFLFHERGITRMEVGADTLAFRARKMGVSFLKLHERSVCVCADSVYFFADGKLFALDGDSVEEIRDAAVAKIDFTQKISGTQAGGEYFASVALQDGVRCVYGYDKAAGCGRFLGISNLAVTGFHGLYRLVRGAVDSVEGSALPEVGKVCAEFCYQPAGSTDGREYLEGVEVEGEGMYEITACAGGMVRKARGRAGERLRFNGALFGSDVKLSVAPVGERFSLRGVVLLRRREETYAD